MRTTKSTPKFRPTIAILSAVIVGSLPVISRAGAADSAPGCDQPSAGTNLATKIHERIEKLELVGVQAALLKAAEFGVLARAHAADLSTLAASDLGAAKAKWSSWVKGVAMASCANHPALESLLQYLNGTPSAVDKVPAELNQLIPVGAATIRLNGKTKTGALCQALLTRTKFGFSATTAETDSQGEWVLRTIAKFQLGLGHRLESLQSKRSQLTAVAVHKAEEDYSSDSVTTLVVNRNGGSITSISITEQDQLSGLSWFAGWRTRVTTHCEL